MEVAVPKNAVFEIALDAELHADLLAAAEAENRVAGEIVSDLVHDYVEQHQVSRDHAAYLGEKVAIARQSVAAGKGRPNEAVEASFAALRKQIDNGGL
jgi:hypothetical protein